MKSKAIKFATAIIITAGLSLNVFDKSVPTVFGVEPVIADSNNVLYVHVKQFNTGQELPNEFWIKSDGQGRVAKARYYLPVTEDGIKLITWTPERTEIWFKSKQGFCIGQFKRAGEWMQEILEQCQPKLVLQKLLEEQKTGVVDVNTSKSQNKQEPAVISATYKDRRDIYYVNQETDLITHIEFYSIENGQDTLVSTMKFYDYNVPIDEKMFSLVDEVPKDIEPVNTLEQLIGIPQGDMTYEQAAAETVRQFFQALIDKDYKKAGQIFSGISEEKTKEYFGNGKLNVTAILSISTPTPYPKCGPHSFRVPCKLEITDSNGNKTTWEPYGPFTRCGDDEMHPDRWIIHGGI